MSEPNRAMAEVPRRRTSGRLLLSAAMAGLGVGVFALVCRAGSAVEAPLVFQRWPLGAAPAGASTAAELLSSLLVVIGAANLLGALFRRLHQPPVIGEILAGIALGPSLLGRFAPGIAERVIAPGVAPYLGAFAHVGIVLFMFLVGVELDKRQARRRAYDALVISHAGIVTPFVLGCVAALWLYSRYASRDVSFSAFALFMGVSMSVTAFPVLARILRERRLQGGRIGLVTLSAAAVEDVTAWCLLAVVVGVVRAESGQGWSMLARTSAYVAAMFLLVRPAVRALVERCEQRGLGRGAFILVCMALLSSAVAAEWAGIHSLFGGFLLGTLVRHDSRLARELEAKLMDLVSVLFLPAFFAVTGLRTQIGLLSGGDAWGATFLVIALATAGKLGGCAVSARLTGMGWRHACQVGVLMNTRGLMELAVLNVGADLGVVPPTLYAMLVVMAVVTTLATTPALDLLRRGELVSRARRRAGARAARGGTVRAMDLNLALGEDPPSAG